MRDDLPTGTVTFLFTDVEGSTKLLHELGAERYAEALAEHRRVIRKACATEGGVEVDTQGDAFFFAFPTAPGAIGAASEFTEALASGPITVRVGLHTGTPLVTEDGYVGGDVHRAARIAACGHGGQVLVSVSTAPLVEFELRDLGKHRLKDLSAPERVYQLGDADFPPLKSLYRTNLPVPGTPFLGRERELSEVVALLEDTRLLTLTGPGGTGKTRLALQAAGMASDAYPDGVWWIPLAPLRDPALVLETAAQVLGSKNGLDEHIQDKRLLCLFDNFEQVVDGASELAPLLRACPNLDLLVTSREPLHLSGEQEYPVPPLVHEEGVGFFLARARAVKPDFAPDDAVSTICARLDDLPLALELAAARVKAFSNAQILERLDERLPLLTGGARDAPERQRTLRATIAWSYELLSTNEQRLFTRFSVFAGGCTFRAAEDVCDADLDTLQSLVDKSLVRYSDERYSMLETIREFAAERQAESGEHESLRRAHARYFVALADEHDVRQFSIAHPEGLAWIASERANLGAALDWAADARDGAVFAVGARVLCSWWIMSGRALEGLRRVESVLATRSTLTPGTIADLLIAGQGLARFTGDIDRALEMSYEYLELTDGTHEKLAIVHADIGEMLVHLGRLDEAEAHLDESLRLDDGPRPKASLAELRLARGEYDTAEELAREAEQGFRGVHSYNVVATQELLGEICRRQGETEQARTWFVAAVRGAAELGDKGLAADCFDGLAALQADLGDAAEADRLAGIAAALHAASGLVPLRPDRRREVAEERASITLDEAIEQTVGQPEPNTSAVDS